MHNTSTRYSCQSTAMRTEWLQDEQRTIIACEERLAQYVAEGISPARIARQQERVDRKRATIAALEQWLANVTPCTVCCKQ